MSNKSAADYKHLIDDIVGEAGDLDRAVTCLREAATLVKRAEDILNGTTGDEDETAEDVKDDPEVPESDEEDDEEKVALAAAEADAAVERDRHHQRLQKYQLKSPLPASYKRSVWALRRQMVRAAVTRTPGWLEYRKNKLGWDNISNVHDHDLFMAATTLGIDTSALYKEALLIQKNDWRLGLGFPARSYVTAPKVSA